MDHERTLEKMLITCAEQFGRHPRKVQGLQINTRKKLSGIASQFAIRKWPSC